MELTIPEKLQLKFRHLVKEGSQCAVNIDCEEEEDDILQSLAQCHRSLRQEAEKDCHLTIRLSLQSIPEEKLPLVHSFSSILMFECGPLHAFLTVDNMTLSWGREGIAEPRFDTETEDNFKTRGNNREEQGLRSDDYIPQMSTNRQMSKFDTVYQSLSEKAQAITRLVEVIVEYNRNKEYNVLECSCENFVQDVMIALNRPLQFGGLLQQRFEQLKQGKLRVPLELKSHVDLYVIAHKGKLERQDMEYLQCLYFNLHLPEIEESNNPTQWHCDIATCMSGELDRMIHPSYISLEQSQPLSDLAIECSKPQASSSELDYAKDECKATTDSSENTDNHAGIYS